MDRSLRFAENFASNYLYLVALVVIAFGPVLYALIRTSSSLLVSREERLKSSVISVLCSSLGTISFIVMQDGVLHGTSDWLYQGLMTLLLLLFYVTLILRKVIVSPNLSRKLLRGEIVANTLTITVFVLRLRSIEGSLPHSLFS